MDNLFIVGDVYGHIDKIKDLLNQWNPDNQRLICLGNLIGRGSDSAGVIELVMQLNKEYGAIVLGGSQEDSFVKWLVNPNVNPIIYYNRGGREVLESFVTDSITKRITPENIGIRIVEDHHEKVSFLCNLPDHSENGRYLVVPAGVRLNISNWRLSATEHFRWGHESFHHGENKTGKIIVFGTMPTKQLHRKDTHDVWISKCKTKIGINGTVDHFGFFHAVHIANDEQRFITA